MNKTKAKVKAFTLVELIVSILILLILGTIAFLSYKGYSKSARDSRRISDISDIKTALGLFALNGSEYPLPDNPGAAYYSGELLWTQGTVGNNVITDLSRTLKKKPIDPLLKIEYTYSVSNTRDEYQLMSLFEGNIANTNNLINYTYAANNYKIKVEGNYNGIFIKTKKYIVPVPSIINSEVTGTGIILNSDNIKSQITTGGTNFPNLDLPNTTVQIGGLDINLSVYTGSITKNSTNQDKINIIYAIQNAYSGTTLSTTSKIKSILDKTTREQLLTLANTILLNNSETLNGECGTANKIYSYIDMSYGTDTFCTIGIPDPTIPTFPVEGSPVNWDCLGRGKPVGTKSSCTSEITATPINGECGTANNTATLTEPSSNLCNMGNLSNLTTNAGTFTWSCDGINLGINASCSAPRQYTITFDGNTNTSGTMSNQTIASGNSANLTTNAFVKTGYIFTGWATTSGGTVVYADGVSYTMGTSDLTLYAKWIIDNHTITFDGNTNTSGAMSNQTIASGNSANLTTNAFVKTGYIFTGWATTSGGTAVYADGVSYTMGTSDLTLYAKWIIDNHTITFDGNTNTSGAMSNQTIASGNSANLTTNAFVKTGYIFTGWATTSGGTAVYADGVSYTMGTSDLTLYAKWTANNYIITFDGNTNTSGTMSNQTIASGNSANLTTNAFVKTGYIFTGWATTSGGSVAYTNGASYTMGTSNLTLYAKWAVLDTVANCTTAGQIGTATTTYSGCNTADIIVCSGNGVGYILSACNVGATSPTTYGNLYQFGKSDTSWINGNATYNYDWKSPGGTNAGSANDWGILEINKTTATWANSDSTSRTKMQGPCASGYHIPTNAEWKGLGVAGAWGSNSAKMQTDIKLSMGGHKNWTDGSMTLLGSGYYWSSSPNGIGSGYDLRFYLNYINFNNNGYRAYGSVIRCFKN